MSDTHSPSAGAPSRAGTSEQNTKKRPPFYRDLAVQVLAGVALGVLVGALVPSVGQHVQFLGDIFIHLIQMVVGLIIFCTVTHGIASVRDLGKVGRIAVRSLIYFEVITTIALVIGLVVVNVLKPGSGMHIDPAHLHTDSSAPAPAKSEGFDDFLVGLVPTSAVQAFAESSILQILVFSVLFACGLASVGEKAQPVLDVVSTVQQALFWIIRKVMRVAPLAAFGAIGYTVSQYGLGTLLSLGRLVAVFYLIVVLFFVLVLWPVSRYAGVSLLKLMRYFRAELVLVLGTSSSESVFPQLTAKLKNLGVDEPVVGLVLPTAYSFNHDGTCLYFAAVSVFLGQATGTDLSWTAQLGLLLVLLLTSKGGAGVSGSAIAVLALTLSATHTIPVSSIALVLGVHSILSAAFVFTNIAGNCVATLVVGKWENAIDRDRLRTQLNAGYQQAA
ncbi:cation:dicarboxylate symporter family transporter [Streptomyces sp. NBC_00588]|jgi:aerobic C4-dicarboxylate transport protein|uniref:cation:dicarboxylate symporter family transporter n=1 Tax=Streptomyces sp. NBC_00588 TaxID=2975784 RepID=UPI002E82131E|nr:cation:dicarboxylase symporter family transporter [Streptomyces sp. NBC_00588]WUB40902.1 cation:dicarboxylase symporter family transporter [Streptomyces sp. NBC_00588]